MSTTSAANSSRVAKRCNRACARCRDMKVRCSGTVPCTRCQRKKESCYFRPEEARVTVSQRYLEALRARSSNVPDDHDEPPPKRRRDVLLQPSPTTSPNSVARTYAVDHQNAASPPPPPPPPPPPSPPPPVHNTAPASAARPESSHSHAPTPADTRLSNDAPNDFKRNPLLNKSDIFVLNSRGKYWYLGPTSSWAFCRRILAMIGSHMPESQPPVEPWDLDALVQLSWTPLGWDEQPNVDDLPSFDYVVMLLHTVKYHLGSFYEIVNHEVFLQHLTTFYREPASKARRSRYWFCQFLFVLAFGEAFTHGGTSSTLPGMHYACRALALIPNVVPMESNPIAAAEALSLGAIYLQALDHRLMSFQLIGQALRICILDGFHRDMPAAQVEESHARRCNTVFWLAYTIDREFSTLVGAPSSIQDEDITTKLPSEVDDSPSAAAMTLQIKLSRLTATILNGVYGVDRDFDGGLLRETQSVLHKLASLSASLTSFLESNPQWSDVRTSKVATRLILHYHHCVVLSTRPLVMCILQRRLASDEDDDKSIPEGPISSLLQSCTYSALNTLKTLRILGDTNLLDCFLPFQLETAWSSAFILKVIDTVSPSFVLDRSWLIAASEIFDRMISRGSPAARLRKRDFQRLESIMASFVEAHEGDRISQSAPDAEAAPEDDDGSTDWQAGTTMHNPDDFDDFLSMGLLDNNSGPMLSPRELLRLADDLHMEDFVVRH